MIRLTISQAIITWLYTNPGVAVDENVDTDMLQANAAAYGLYKTPQTNVITYIDGTRDITAYYTFHVRQRVNQESTRQSNQEWLEAFEAWVLSQSRARNLPALPSPSTCERVFIANTFSMEQAENNEAVYQLTIGINYINRAI